MRYVFGAFLVFTIGYFGGDILVASLWLGAVYGFIDTMRQGKI